MQTAATNSLVLTDLSSLKRFADSKTAISYGGFYQELISQLAKGVYSNQVLHDLGEMLVVVAEHAYGFRQIDAIERVSQILMNSPVPRQYKAVGRYYRALYIQRFGLGDVERAVGLLERVAETAPPRYRVRAMISLAANSRCQRDNQSALSLYSEAARFASCSNIYDAYAAIHTQKMAAVIGSEDGNHRDALALLESLFPLANAVRSSQPHAYYDYMNSLAVELCEVGRLEEAKNVSQIVLASPFISAYPEWRETREEIELRGWRAPRSEVAFSQRTFEAENLVHLPVRQRYDSLGADELSPPSEPARVLSLQEWKKRMPKQSNGDPKDKTTPRPTTTEEKSARLKELEKLTTREKLLSIMNMLGDERVGDDLLLRALIILEGLEPDENQGS